MRFHIECSFLDLSPFLSELHHLLLTPAQCSETRGEYFTNLIPDGTETLTEREMKRPAMCSGIACTYVHISLLSPSAPMGCERTRVGEVEGERSVCDVFVWEMAGGYRFTVAGLAEGRKERLFKRLPTDSCSPIEPPLSATASHIHSPSARRDI